MAQNYIVATLALLFCSPVVLCQDQCTPRNYPAFFDISLRLPRILWTFYTPPGQILVTNYQFGCNGFVSKWEMYCLRSGAQTVEFHVWRRNTSIDGVTAYNLVGKNVIPNARPDRNNLFLYSVPRHQWIQVQPGDIVGIRGYNATQPDNFQLQVHASFDLTNVIGYNLREDEATPEFLNLAEYGASPALGIPNMRVTIIEIVSTTTMVSDQASSTVPTTTTSTFAISPTVESSPGGDLPTTTPDLTLGSFRNTMIGVAIIIAVIITIVIVFTVSVVCGYHILKAKRNRQQHNRNIYSQPNQSYNVRPVLVVPPPDTEETDHTYEELDSQHNGSTTYYDYNGAVNDGHEIQMTTNTLDEEGYI